MAASLTPAERTKLVGILARLGSDFDGERAAAALLANRMVKAKGLSWADLIGEPSKDRIDEPSPGPSMGWVADLAFCRRHIGSLSGKDGEFIISLGGGRKIPTVRQRSWLSDVCERLRRAGHG